MFGRRIGTRLLSFRREGPRVDQAGARWAPTGRCQGGPLAGTELPELPAYDVMWFAWYATLGGPGRAGEGAGGDQPHLLVAADDGFLGGTIAYGRWETPMFPSLRGLDGVRQLSEHEICDVVAYPRSREGRK